MRRVSGPQPGGSYYLRKEINRAKSPLHPSKSRGKVTHISNSSNNIPSRKGTSFHKNDCNQSSTNFTSNKTKKHNPKPQKTKVLKKYEKQIMNVLNASATLIQRQWRKYIIRKYRKIRQSIEKKQQQPELHSPVESVPKNLQVSILNKYGNEERSISEQNSQTFNYNNGKYFPCDPLQSNKKNSENSFNRNIFNFNISEKKISESHPEPLLRNQVQNGHLRTTSDKADQLSRKKSRILEETVKVDELSEVRGFDPFIEAKYPLKEKEICPQKQLGLSSTILSVKIENRPSEEMEQPKEQKNNKRITRPMSPHYHANRYEDQFVANEKNMLEDMLKKLQHGLQQKKIKKILAIESSFSNNLMTYRSYQNNVKQITEEHSKKLSILELKKQKLISKWDQLIEIYDGDQESSISAVDSIKHHGDGHHVNAIDADDEDISLTQSVTGFNSKSIVFEEWDFDSGRKQCPPPDWDKFSPKIPQHNQKDPQPPNPVVKKLPFEDHSEVNGDTEQLRQILQSNLIEAMKEQPAQNSLPELNPREMGMEAAIIPQNVLSEGNQTLIADLQFDKSQKVEDSLRQTFQKPQAPQIVKNLQQNQEINLITPQKQYLPIQQTVIDPSSPTNPIKPLNGRIEPIVIEEQQEPVFEFQPINPDVQFVNAWLLQISHFVLDHYGKQFFNKLVYVDQPSARELWIHCIAQIPYTKQYHAIPYKAFKQFQYYNIRNQVERLGIEEGKKQSFSALMFTIHQALYDCLNKMLLDELIYGRQWVNIPWDSTFKIKKNIGPDHAKQSLQKAINRVSNLSDYGMFSLGVDRFQNRDYQEAHNLLIFAEQIKQIPLDSQFYKGCILNEIFVVCFEEILIQESSILLQQFKKGQT